jgi:hypothetical protein
LRAFFFFPSKFSVSHFVHFLFLVEVSQLLPKENWPYLRSRKFLPSTSYCKAMKKKLDTDDVIESLIVATLGEQPNARQRHMYRESLRSLVRLAKAEQVVEIKASVKRLTGILDSQSARRRAKAILLAQRLPGIFDQAQQQFEFKQ